MKDLKVKLGKKGFRKKCGWTNGFVKPSGKLWKRYFMKKKRQVPLGEQINDNNWWEWV
jgi:hypothetical protein